LGEKFYNEIFLGDDKEKINQMLNNDDKVLHLLLTGIPNNPKSNKKSLQIIGSVSFYVEIDGSFASWIAVSMATYNHNNWVSRKKTKKSRAEFDDLPFRQTKRIGSFLLSVVQQISQTSNRKETIYCQVRTDDSVLYFYRCWLRFQFIELPPESMNDYCQDHESLWLHRSISSVGDSDVATKAYYWRTMADLIEHVCDFIFRIRIKGIDVLSKDNSLGDYVHNQSQHLMAYHKKIIKEEVDAIDKCTLDILNRPGNITQTSLEFVTEHTSSIEQSCSSFVIPHGSRGYVFLINYALWRLGVVDTMADEEEPTLHSRTFFFSFVSIILPIICLRKI
jgi:hypothetical protein